MTEALLEPPPKILALLEARAPLEGLGLLASWPWMAGMPRGDGKSNSSAEPAGDVVVQFDVEFPDTPPTSAQCAALREAFPEAAAGMAETAEHVHTLTS